MHFYNFMVKIKLYLLQYQKLEYKWKNKKDINLF
jgi:hypothetical protein